VRRSRLPLLACWPHRHCPKQKRMNSGVFCFLVFHKNSQKSYILHFAFCHFVLKNKKQKTKTKISRVRENSRTIKCIMEKLRNSEDFGFQHLSVDDSLKFSTYPKDISIFRDKRRVSLTRWRRRVGRLTTSSSTVVCGNRT
jgi:hypothetical protein